MVVGQGQCFETSTRQTSTNQYRKLELVFFFSFHVRLSGLLSKLAAGLSDKVWIKMSGKALIGVH